MAVAKAEELHLTAEQHHILRDIVDDQVIDPHIARRAAIVLAIAESNVSNAQVARQLGTSASTVSSWRNRWMSHVNGSENRSSSVPDSKQKILAVLGDKSSRADSDSGEPDADEIGPGDVGHRHSTPNSYPVEDITTEVGRLRSKVDQLLQEKQDLELILDTLTEHSDTVSEELQQENEDLQFMLEMTTEHSDSVSEELEHRNAELLAESERRLRLIVQATPVPVIISRISDREIQYVNPMAKSLLGLSDGTIAGQRITDFFCRPTDWKHLLEELSQVGEVNAYEMEIKLPDDSERWVTFCMRPLEFNDESSVLAAIHDITERKRVAMRLQQQVEVLRLELDEARHSSKLAEDTGTAFFSNLDAEAIKQTGVRLVVMHSFRGGTGKSTITANLAALLASSGYRVGVVDTDIQAPGVHLQFGRSGTEFDYTFNDLLWGNCTPQQVAVDVTEHLGTGIIEHLFLIPASINPGHMAQMLSQGYEAQRLTRGMHHIAETLRLDILLIDTHPGLNEEALLSMEHAHASLIVMRPEQPDYEGTGVTVQVARKLQAQTVGLIVNNVPPSVERQAVRSRVEKTFGLPVATVLPHVDELFTFEGNGLFVMQHPEHPFTVGLYQLSRSLMGIAETGPA